MSRHHDLAPVHLLCVVRRADGTVVPLLPVDLDPRTADDIRRALMEVRPKLMAVLYPQDPTKLSPMTKIGLAGPVMEAIGCWGCFYHGVVLYRSKEQALADLVRLHPGVVRLWEKGKKYQDFIREAWNNEAATLPLPKTATLEAFLQWRTDDPTTP